MFSYCKATPYIFRKVLYFDILCKNVLIQTELIGSGQLYPTLTWLIRFEDFWNSNNLRKVEVIQFFFLHVDTNRNQKLQIKGVFLSLCKDMLKGLRRRDAFLLIIFIIIAIIINIIITIAFYLTSVEIHINYNID